MRMIKLLTAALLLGLAFPALAADLEGKLYKNPNCGCCEVYAKHLRESGIDIEIVETNDLRAVKDEHGIPDRLLACHTTVIGHQVFEGHIFAEDIKRFIKEEPMARGLAVPGMPVGTPGMAGEQRGPIHAYYLSDASQPQIYATH